MNLYKEEGKTLNNRLYRILQPFNLNKKTGFYKYIITVSASEHETASFLGTAFLPLLHGLGGGRQQSVQTPETGEM